VYSTGGGDGKLLKDRKKCLPPRREEREGRGRAVSRISEGRHTRCEGNQKDQGGKASHGKDLGGGSSGSAEERRSCTRKAHPVAQDKDHKGGPSRGGSQGK